MKRNILTSLILITAVLTSTVKAYGTVEVRQRLLTNAEPAVAVQMLGQNTQGEIDPATGTHGGLSASFRITTNSDDSGYDYYLTATTPASESTSAFADISGTKALLFVNLENEPSYNDVVRARIGNVLNRNVIAYPFNVNIESPMTIEYKASHPKYGNCWQIKTNSGESAVLSQTIGASPIPITYDVAQDTAGTYQATVIFTAIAK